MDIQTALEEYAATILAAGIRATADPNALRPPAVLVEDVAFAPDSLGAAWRIDAQLVVIGPDNGERHSRRALTGMVSDVLDVVGRPAGDITPGVARLPSRDPDQRIPPLPCYTIPVRFTYTPTEEE